MNKEAKSLVKKTAKIAGVTCVAAGAVALMTTGAALKALTEGAKYLKNIVQKIIDEPAESEVVNDMAVAEKDLTEEAVTAEESTAIEASCVQ